MRVSIYKYQDMTDDSQESMYWNGIYTGIKYQCVELARRYYLIKYGLLFDNVRTAKDIVHLHTIYSMESKRYIQWPTYLNEGIPIVGSLLIWDITDEFPKTGHVAIVTKVTQKYVEVIEQNYRTGRREIPIENGKLATKGLLAFKMPPCYT
jgi:hypothetical protein